MASFVKPLQFSVEVTLYHTKAKLIKHRCWKPIILVLIERKLNGDSKNDIYLQKQLVNSNQPASINGRMLK